MLDLVHSSFNLLNSRYLQGDPCGYPTRCVCLCGLERECRTQFRLMGFYPRKCPVIGGKMGVLLSRSTRLVRKLSPAATGVLRMGMECLEQFHIDYVSNTSGNNLFNIHNLIPQLLYHVNSQFQTYHGFSSSLRSEVINPFLDLNKHWCVNTSKLRT